MRKNKLFISLLLLLLTACVHTVTQQSGSSGLSENSPNMLRRYQMAEKLLPVNLRNQVENLYLNPVWLDDGGFWFQLTHKQKKRFWRYRPQQGITPLFDLDKLKALPDFASFKLKFDDIRVVRVQGDTLTLEVDMRHWHCQLGEIYQCEGGWMKPKPEPPLISPDEQWQVLVKNHNLVLLNKSTGEKTQLTQDGSADFPYATESPNPKKLFNQPVGSVVLNKIGSWSPDSRYFVTFQLDLRKAGKLHLSQSVTGDSQRPRIYQYHYPMAGDEHLIQGHMVVIDIDTGEVKPIANPPLNQTYYGDPLWGEFADNNKYYFVQRERGYHTYHLKEFSPQTGEVRTLITEKNQKFLDPWVQDFDVLPDLDTVLWTSERSGMQQVWRYQLSTGKRLNAVTPDNMFMRVIRAIDEERQQMFFEASGGLPGDTYYRYLYRVDLNGSGLTLLTPETLMHDTRIAPDFKTFTDSYSTVQEPTKHTVRSTLDGRVLDTLHTVDNRELLSSGYTEPEPFTLMAEDGTTALHGILYFPSDFDTNKRYPVIDDIYTGPHGFFTPKTYDGPLYSHAHALAELGFIVLKMDGRGTGKRDRTFHEYSYDNLAGGADDHVWALQQLAKSRSYLDLDRVGIFGFSAGGYDTVRAMYKYPDFFKVGISASGNHDFRADKAGWNETWMGYPVEDHWDQQSNLNGAEKLQGKLLLAHGELDENVHPAATLQLVDKLIKANKDFDFIIYPNMGHVLHQHPHFVRTRWDYFVEHLLGASPPKNYHIKDMPIPAMAR